MQIKIRCPSCVNVFDTLPNLNRHIGMTKHNGGKSISVKEFLSSVGINLRISTTE